MTWMDGLEWVLVISFSSAIPYGFYRGFSWLNRHAISLQGRRAKRYEQDATKNPSAFYYRYRFAIQNRENVSLRRNLRVKISIKDTRGQFLSDGIKVYAGPSDIRVKDDENREDNAVFLGFKELPASETWVITCDTNSIARHLVLRLYEVDLEGKRVVRRLPLLSNSKLEIPPARDNVREGSTRTPGISFAFATLVWSLSLYFFPIVVLSLFPFPGKEFYSGFDSELDAAIAIGMAAVWGLLLWASQRPSPPVVQGYWRGSQPTRSRGAEPTSSLEKEE